MPFNINIYTGGFAILELLLDGVNLDCIFSFTLFTHIRRIGIGIL
jgi:hypothetical protein